MVDEHHLSPTTISSTSTRELFSMQVALGWSQTCCALTNTNKVQCWGDNSYGRHVDGTKQSYSMQSLGFGGG